ncbi:MAG: ribonuclease Y [Nitrospirae bacterium]|nr:ribonuclease Y [Nitrospirota bacterium]MBI5695941.1 ribonuclease Y [Nitrospirota bacterium]
MTYVWIAVAAVVGFVIGMLIKRGMAETKIQEAEEQAKRILKDAERDADTKKKELLLEAKDKLYQQRSDFEKEVKDRRNEIAAVEKRHLQKEEHLDKKSDQLDKRDTDLTNKEREQANREKAISDKEQRYEEGIQEQKKQLERIAGMSTEEAKRELVNRMEEEARHEAAKSIKRIEEEAKSTAGAKSKEIISLAIQRYSSDYVAESTVSLVNLPNDEMKGRIIGREGRNIRALEAATGIDLIIDDTPQAVIVSGFDPVRREVAKIAIERLMADGRIHPGRIEEIVEKIKKELDDTMREEGEKAVFDLALHGIHPEIVRLIGRLKYRTSYGQNVLMHSREVAFLAGVMAAELGVDVKLAKRAGLLHDLGKAVDHEIEGTHSSIGFDIAKKYGENPKVLNAIISHHGDEEASCVESVLVAAADALSAARPGARRETLETYVKRLEKLEEISSSFKGVEKTFAIQAGREIRVIVKPEDVDDVYASQISREIARKIEEEMAYPGQIKVTVIREARYVEYAK